METSAIYAISIPSQICFDIRLCPAAKLFYGEVARLCQEYGRCSLSNHYFAGLYQVTTKTVATWINQLEEAGYLRIRYNESQQRLLYLEALEEKPTTYQISLNL